METTLGGDASVAAGPVGRQTGASSLTSSSTRRCTWSLTHSKLLYAGLELKGVVIKPDTADVSNMLRPRF